MTAITTRTRSSPLWGMGGCASCIVGARCGCHGALLENAAFEHPCIFLKVEGTVLDAEEVWNRQDF